MQLVSLLITGIVFVPTVVVQSSGAGQDYLSWALFAAIITAGLATLAQAKKMGKVGSGYNMAMGGSATFIAVSITALSEGGPAMLATLVLLSSLVPLILSTKLSLLRRILTPTIFGTLVMLISVAVMPVVFDMLKKTPDGTSPLAAPLCTTVTILIIVGFTLKGKGILRLFAPVIGIIFGAITASFFDLYDTDAIAKASWFGLPSGSWPGMDLHFGKTFWKLLPSFIFVALIDTAKTMSYVMAVQRISWRRQRAIDFQEIQGAMMAMGLGNILCGLAGVLPNSVRPTSISVNEITGVTARHVGIVTGFVLIVLAFFPKFFAVILAIPAPVVAAYLIILLSLLFVSGMKSVVQANLDYRKGLIVGLSFWVGIGTQSGAIFPEYISTFAGGIFESGIMSGGLVAFIATLFMTLTQSRRHRMKIDFNFDQLPKISEFLCKFASRHGWGEEMKNRMTSVSEEVLLTCFSNEEEKKHLLLIVYREEDRAMMEFTISVNQKNIEDHLAFLGKQIADIPMEKEISLRLLKHLASSVRHEQYHGIDVITVSVGAIDSNENKLNQNYLKV